MGMMLYLWRGYLLPPTSPAMVLLHRSFLPLHDQGLSNRVHLLCGDLPCGEGRLPLHLFKVCPHRGSDDCQCTEKEEKGIPTVAPWGALLCNPVRYEDVVGALNDLLQDTGAMGALSNSSGGEDAYVGEKVGPIHIRS